MDNNINVLMVGSALNVKGGMTTVVENFIGNKFKNIKLYYVATHIEKSKILQVIYFILSIFKVLYYILVKNITIIHMHFSERGSFYRKYIILKIGKIFKKKIIIHMHGAEFKQIFESSNQKIKYKITEFLRESDKVIVLGESWENYVNSIDSDIKTIIMPNSVQYPEYIVARAKNNINILFLAVLTRRKGIFDLINAANIILKNNKITDKKIKFTIAGSGESENDAKKMVKELGLDKNFEFVGWVNNEKKNQLLRNSQIFVLPSYNEGLPMAILEAMSYGIPVITTNVGSIEDVIKNDRTGLIHSPGKIEELVKCIEVCINDEKKWQEFSSNGKQLIEHRYNKEKYFENMENLYCNIVGENI